MITRNCFPLEMFANEAHLLHHWRGRNNFPSCGDERGEKDLSKVKGTAQKELLWGCCLVNSSGAAMPVSMGSRHHRASDQSRVLGRDSGTGLRHSAQRLSTAQPRSQEPAVTSLSTHRLEHHSQENRITTINFTLGAKRSEMSSLASPPDDSSANRQQSRLPRATRKGTRPDAGSHSETAPGSGVLPGTLS